MTQKRISSLISRAIAINILIATAITTAAQVKQNVKTKDVAEQEKDSVAFFRGVAVSADLVGLAQIAFSDYGQYEAALRFNLKDRYFPVFELGYGTADTDNPTTQMRYKTSAPYGRIGMDFNIAKHKHDDYRIYIGARYALTYYKFDFSSYNLKDPVWGDDAAYERKGVKANYHWAELLFGVDAKIAGPLRLGWSVRYRKRLFHNDGDAGNTWYVPGFGKQGGTRLGGTFNVTLEL